MPQIWDSLPSAARQQFDPPFRLDQICDWVFRHHVVNPGAMTNLSKAMRQELVAERLYRSDLLLTTATSEDGSVKALFGDGERRWETVWMPFADHNTLCVSSQSGCRMGCKFCATAALASATNLTAGEILGQLFWATSSGKIVDRVVFMGMGEPLANYQAIHAAISWLVAKSGGSWSPSRITVSTAGIIAPMDRLWDELRVHLAISLNGYDDSSRSSWMPIGETVTFGRLIDWARQRAGGRRRITFEYILAGGRTDQPSHAAALAGALQGIPIRVNLIPWNDWGNPEIRPVNEVAIEQFARRLSRAGVIVTVRRSRGQDIRGACGQLAASGEPDAA